MQEIDAFHQFSGLTNMRKMFRMYIMNSWTPMTSFNRSTRIGTLVGVCLAMASGAWAQIGTVNSAIVTTGFFHDFTSGTETAGNDYPTFISLGEFNAGRAASGGLNRDIWQFSNNGGSSAYTLGANDYFSVSMTMFMFGESGTVDSEAGFIIPNANGGFGGGDLQFIAKASQDHFIGMFGGTGFWNSGLSYSVNTPVTLGMSYFFDTAANENALKFWVTYNGSTVYSPIQDWTGNLAGDTLGGYYQIGNGGTSPGASGQAVFANIGLTAVPEPSVLALLGLGGLAMVLRRRS
jgi:hypothetical protein